MAPGWPSGLRGPVRPLAPAPREAPAASGVPRLVETAPWPPYPVGMADLVSKLDEITAMVENARTLPLSASCVLHRDDVLAALDEVRALLPSEIATASSIVAEQRQLIADAEREAEQVIARAREERARLVSRTEIAAHAAGEAEQILAEARAAAQAMRTEVEDYADAKLATFEVVLQRTLAAVERGRDKLRGRHELDQLRDDDGAGVLPN